MAASARPARRAAMVSAAKRANWMAPCTGRNAIMSPSTKISGMSRLMTVTRPARSTSAPSPRQRPTADSRTQRTPCADSVALRRPDLALPGVRPQRPRRSRTRSSSSRRPAWPAPPRCLWPGYSRSEGSGCSAPSTRMTRAFVRSRCCELTPFSEAARNEPRFRCA